MYESFDENSENYDLAIIDQQIDFIVVNPDSRPVGLLVSGTPVISSLFEPTNQVILNQLPYRTL